MPDSAEFQREDIETWDQPEDKSFDEWMESRVARFETRTYDWDALKFQADYDPKYARAQCRYMGTGGAGVEHDENVVPSEHFTFSTMILPAGSEGPPHIHVDVEEVFFMLRGSIRLIIDGDNDARYETILKERDLMSVPPGVYRELVNIGKEEALMLVMLGSKKPVIPTYPPDHPLAQLKRK
ncbi:MAG: cupin domain-containing protein [Alphaproteobacteria bacterium]|nr:cupin domain-containing protein [Alphaproteobacteria bacterium]